MLRCLLVLLGTATLCFAHLETSQCGKTKECVMVPEGCEGTSCRQVFTYSTKADDGWTDIELYTTRDTPSNNYMAVGLSADDVMGDDFVSHCMFPESGKPEVHVTYNFGKSNAPPSEAIDVTSEKDHIELIHAHADDAGLYCNYRQKSTKAKSQFVPNLNKDYTVFLARGKARNPRALGIHSLDPASPDFPFITDKKVNIGRIQRAEEPTAATEPNKTVAGAPEEPSTTVAVGVPLGLSRATRLFIIKMHGALMVASWLCLVAVAVLTARYFKDNFHEYSPMGVKIWFLLHRGFNVLAVVVMLVAIFLIFLAKDWTWQGPNPSHSAEQNTGPGSIHSLFGLIAVFLGTIQPFIALARCAPDTGARPIFNWTHRIIGVTAYICAVIAAFIAAKWFSSLWSDRNWSLALIIFYILVIFVVVALFEILNRLKTRTSKTSDIEMRKGRNSNYDQYGRVQVTVVNLNKKPLYGITALLILFALFTICLVAALILLLFI